MSSLVGRPVQMETGVFYCTPRTLGGSVLKVQYTRLQVPRDILTQPSKIRSIPSRSGTAISQSFDSAGNGKASENIYKGHHMFRTGNAILYKLSALHTLVIPAPSPRHTIGRHVAHIAPSDGLCGYRYFPSSVCTICGSLEDPLWR